MKVDIQKQLRSIRWLTENTLTEEQRKQLFKEKLERAAIAHQALKRREDLVKVR